MFNRIKIVAVKDVINTISQENSHPLAFIHHYEEPLKYSLAN